MRKTFAFWMAAWLASSVVLGQAHAEVPRDTPRDAPARFARPHHIEVAPAKKIQAVLTCNYSAKELGVTRWTVVVPQAPVLNSQRQVSTSSWVSPHGGRGTRGRELSEAKRPILTFVASVKRRRLGDSAELKVVYRATLCSVRLLPGRSKVPVAALSDRDRKLYTRFSETIDSPPELREFLSREGLQRREGEAELQFAYRGFRFIADRYTYDYDARDWRASSVFQTRKADCGGMSVLFTSIVRSSEVPARVLAGRWAKSKKEWSKYGQWHCIAEFFAEGIGWVPVDLAGAVTAKNAWFKLRKANDHFGGSSGNFLTMHVDTDLVLGGFPSGRESFPLMQLPAYWYKSRKGSGEVARTENWEVKVIAKGEKLRRQSGRTVRAISR